MRGLVVLLTTLAGLAVALAAPTPRERRDDAVARLAWNPAGPGGPGSPVTDVAFAPDGRTLASLHEDRTVWNWDVAAGKATGWVAVPLDEDERPTRVQYTPAGEPVVLLRRRDKGNTASARVWFAATGRRSPPAPTGWAPALAPRAELLASEAGLFEVATGRPVRAVERPREGLVYDVQFSPDGKTLAYWVCESLAQDMSIIYLADVGTGRKVLQIGRLDYKVEEFLSRPALSPDGRAVAFRGSGPNSLRAWDVAGGRATWAVPGGGGHEMVGFTPDGEALVTWTRWAGRDNPGRAVHLWDAETGKALRAVPVRGAVQSAALSPDGKVAALAKGNAVEFLRLTD